MNHKPGSLEEAAQNILSEKVSSKEVKEMAQKQIMYAVTNVLYHVRDDGELKKDPEFQKAVLKEVPRQVKRIEKLFGYVPGSWILD